MKIKKLIISIAAVLLLFAMTIAGTLAVMNSRTNEVKNTFVAAGGGSLFDANGEIILNESKAKLNAETGEYVLDIAEKVVTNSYSVIPGATVAKDPAISITGKNEVPAYVYVEIVDDTGANITWEIANEWMETGVTGPNGGSVYHLQNPIVSDLTATYILKNNQIKVAAELELGDAGKPMTFYGYIAQSVVDNNTNAAYVFTASFLGDNN